MIQNLFEEIFNRLLLTSVHLKTSAQFDIANKNNLKTGFIKNIGKEYLQAPEFNHKPFIAVLSSNFGRQCLS
jgi:hypothetical protein